jgi:hypothetical protein
MDPAVAVYQVEPRDDIHTLFHDIYQLAIVSGTSPLKWTMKLAQELQQSWKSRQRYTSRPPADHTLCKLSTASVADFLSSYPKAR